MTKLSRSECTVDIGGNVSLCDLHGDKPCCQVYLRDNKKACYKEDFTLAGQIKTKIGNSFSQLYPDYFYTCAFFLRVRKFSNKNFLSISPPIRAIPLPIVNAASIVPMPRPFMRPKQKNVRPAVTARQVISKAIFILEYLTPVMSESSLGNRSVGIIGRPL